MTMRRDTGHNALVPANAAGATSSIWALITMLGIDRSCPGHAGCVVCKFVSFRIWRRIVRHRPSGGGLPIDDASLARLKERGSKHRPANNIQRTDILPGVDLRRQGGLYDVTHSTESRSNPLLESMTVLIRCSPPLRADLSCSGRRNKEDCKSSTGHKHPAEIDRRRHLNW